MFPDLDKPFKSVDILKLLQMAFCLQLERELNPLGRFSKGKKQMRRKGKMKRIMKMRRKRKRKRKGKKKRYCINQYLDV